jgi:hypothetical protein
MSEEDMGTARLPDETIARLEAKYGTYGEGIFEVRTLVGNLVFRKPRPSEWRQFTDTITREKGSREACMRNLCFQCFVFPDNGEGKPDVPVFESLYERQPGKIQMLIEELSRLAGISDQLDVVKR